MSTSNIYKPQFGIKGEIRELTNSGASATYNNGAGTFVLNATSNQDLISITGTSVASLYQLPSGLTTNQIGVTKIINSVSGGTTSSMAIVPGNGQVIERTPGVLVGVNGATIVTAAFGASLTLQYVALNRWRIVRIAGTVTFP